MAHVNEDALRHLPKAATGVEITNISTYQGEGTPCEDCRIAHAPRQVSRRPMMTATEPFERVHFDLIDMECGLNEDRWVTHFYDEATRMHAVYTHRVKSDCVNAVRLFVNRAKNVYKRDVHFLRSDQEKSLGREIQTIREVHGIAHQYTVRATPEQNGAAERAGAVLISRTRKALLAARLPADLWPWVIHAITGIVNRTPMRVLNWKTPWEALTGNKPSLASMYTIGCIAYTRQEQLKRAKMAPRAYRGINLGPIASNIWNIWNPKTQKVETARDVQFDESRMYNPDQPFLEDQLLSKSPTPPIDVVQDQDAEPNGLSDETGLDDIILASDSEDTGNNAKPDRHPGGVDKQPREYGTSTGYVTPPRTSTEATPSPYIPGAFQDATDLSNGGDTPASMMTGTRNPVVEEGVPSFDPLGRATDNDRALVDSALDPGGSGGEGLTGGIEIQTQEGGGDGGAVPSHGSMHLPAPTGGAVPSQRDSSDHDLPRSSRSEGGRDGIDTSNIIESKRTRRARKDEDFHAYASQESFIQEPERDEYAFAIAASMADQRKKHWHRSELPEPPETFAQALRHPLKDEFLQATRIEIGKLEAREVFTLDKAENAGNAQILPLRWVFTYKFDEGGYLEKAKARICVRGDLERDMASNNYAATASAKTFRAVMAFVAAFNMDTDQKDAVNAFLNAILHQPVYTKTPDGFRVKGKVWRVTKALYGLRKAPRLWQQDLATTLLNHGLLPVPEEECLYSNEFMIVLVYVDDFIIANHPTKRAQDAADRFKRELANRYELRHLGEAKWFLGVRILRDREARKVWLCQDAYAEHVAARFHLHELTKWPKTPLTTAIDISPNQDKATDAQIKEYQMKVGSIQYSAVLTRPDIAYAVSRLAEALTNPSPNHIEMANRVIAYLYNTRFLAIEYSGDSSNEEVVMVASDAAFADRPDRSSSAGYICKLYDGPIEWRSGKQRAVTTSTTEAEFLALSDAAKAVYWWKRVFRTMHFDPQHGLLISCDNRQTIHLLTDEDIQQRSKLRHVDIHRSWLRQEVQRGDLQVKWIPTAQMPADGLTKHLPIQKHQEFLKMLNMTSIESLIQA